MIPTSPATGLQGGKAARGRLRAMKGETMPPDWIEAKTAELLAAGRRSGCLAQMIRDAEWFARDGYVWDVALAIAAEYWTSRRY